MREGQVYSQALVTTTEDYLTRRLGNEGYNFATVTGIPEVEDGAKVKIKFFVDPGKRTYVRRIDFNGNLDTADDVLRREMRQMEAAPASAAAIEQGRVRLQRLGFFKTMEFGKKNEGPQTSPSKCPKSRDRYFEEMRVVSEGCPYGGLIGIQILLIFNLNFSRCALVEVAYKVVCS